jgi:16S rRNA (guanine527-N7)-methyltransferase
MELSEFWTICSANAIILDGEMMANIDRFHREIIYWNEKVNLISRQDVQNILEKHILHSLSILKYEKIINKARILDIGTGGGFPGTPIKIARPDVFLTLVDSVSKKLKIAEMLAKHTELRNIEAYSTRVENLQAKPNYLRKFDYIVSRAVAPSVQLISWSLPMLKDNGKYIFLKGGDLQNEYDEVYEYFPNLKHTEQTIELVGFDYFTKEDKKIITFSFDKL